MLDTLQSLLERVYHLELSVRVEDFYVDGRRLDELAAQGAHCSSAQEQLLVLEESTGDASLALFIDETVLARVQQRDPVEPLAGEALHDFCLVAEGVSHFVYLAWKALRGEPVTQLELELQAEVDKYVACFVARWEQDHGRFPDELKAALFRTVTFRADLAPEERDRYRTANRLALQYCHYLERSFLRDGGLHGAVPELRRFYRMTQPRKLDHIAARD